MKNKKSDFSFITRILFAFTFCLGLVIFIPSGVEAETLSDFPDPYNYVNDFANVLSDSTESELNNLLYSLETSDSTQIFVITVNTLPSDVYLENFIPSLTDLNSKWAAGQEKQDNGAILTVVVEDRDMRIDVGYGLEGVMPDIVSKHILDDEIKPYFQDGDYDAGVLAGVNAMTQVVKGEYSVTAESIEQDNRLDSFFSGVTVCGTVFMFLVFPILTSLLGSTKSWWLGGVLGILLGLALGVFIFRFDFLGIFRYLSFIILPLFFGPLGLLFDYIVSKNHKMWTSVGSAGRIGRTSSFGRSGFSGGSSGGGFSGGGGGSFGGGGSSSSW